MCGDFKALFGRAMAKQYRIILNIFHYIHGHSPLWCVCKYGHMSRF